MYEAWQSIPSIYILVPAQISANIIIFLDRDSQVGMKVAV